MSSRIKRLSLYAPSRVSSLSFQLWKVVEVSLVTLAYCAAVGVDTVWFWFDVDIRMVSVVECDAIDDSESVTSGSGDRTVESVMNRFLAQGDVAGG